MGRVQWDTFDRLTAAQVQTVSDQTVMRFATEAARDTALPVGVRAAGMVTWVDAPGELQFFDGTSWEPLLLGPQGAQAAVSLGDIATRERRTYSPSAAVNVWGELTSGFADDIVIYTLTMSTAASGGTSMQLGVGPSGSEVVVAEVPATGTNVQAVRPYGVPVPAGTRIAARRVGSSGSGGNVGWGEVVVATANTPGRSGMYNFTSATAWTEVAATPPVAGGVWVTAIAGGGTWTQLGFGAAAAEVAATPEMTAIDGLYDPVPPLWWAPGTRLARRHGIGSLSGFRLWWRENLT